jgi:hypothetical protein
LADEEIARDFVGSDNRVGRQFHALTFVAVKVRDGERRRGLRRKFFGGADFEKLKPRRTWQALILLRARLSPSHGYGATGRRDKNLKCRRV